MDTHLLILFLPCFTVIIINFSRFSTNKFANFGHIDLTTDPCFAFIFKSYYISIFSTSACRSAKTKEVVVHISGLWVAVCLYNETPAF